MNSMIRQHHLRISDVKTYLRTFDRHKPLSPDEWAVQESNFYDPGYLIFCLESVAPPAGLSTFSKRGEEQGETFRVKDLCVIVSKDDGKCVAVIVSPSAYEFRVLDNLLLEKAMRAILDGRDFHYLAARPVQRLNGEAVKALYKMGSNYAKGGSRRTLTADGAVLQEPALALLGQLGAKLGAQANKQLLDIGSVCHMIFTPEGRQEDKSKSIIKSTFVPVLADDTSAAPAPAQPTHTADGQPLYSIDPMTPGDLSAIAPQADAQATTQALAAPELSPFAPPAADSPYAPQSVESLNPANTEPQTNFNDFGMSLLSALAPDMPAANPAFQNLNSSEPVATSLPSVGAMAANMDTLPPSNPNASYTDLSAMDNLDRNNFASPSSSFTDLAGMPPAQAEPAAESNNADAQSAQGNPAAPYLRGAPTNFPASASQVNIPAARPVPIARGTGGSAPPWFVLSHDAVPARASQINQSASEPVGQSPGQSGQNMSAVGDTQGLPSLPEPPAGYAAAQSEGSESAASAEAAAPKEDFSAQFFNDMQSGMAGSAAIDAAEQERLDEQRRRDESDPAKEQRLKDYFGEDHFHKYVKGESGIAAKGDTWNLDPNQYKTDLANQPDFDGDIFANAARSTLETNPEAAFIAPPKEEITGPPPDPSWTAPETTEATPQASVFDAMLTAGGDSTIASDAPLEVPSTGDNAAAMADADSNLFDRLAGELSAQTGSTTAADAVQPAPADAAPTTVNWSPTAAEAENGSMWPSISPSESLFATPEADAGQSSFAPNGEIKTLPLAKSPASELAALGIGDDVSEGGFDGEDNTFGKSANQASNQSVVAPDQTSDSEIKSETFAPTASGISPALPESVEGSTEIAVDAASSSADIAESMQPRVRPRDYSSPLRAPKPLTASGNHSLSPVNSVRPNAASNKSLPVSSITSPAQISEPTPNSASPEIIPVAPNAQTMPEPVAAVEVAQPELAALAQLEIQILAQPEASAEPAPAPVVEAPVAEIPVLAAPVQEEPAAPVSTSKARSLSPSSEALTAPSASSSDSSGQDTRLMMNEMTSLMSKLELQVAKAANKIASRADELRGRMSLQVDGLVKEAQDVEKTAEGNLIALASEFKAKLDALATEVQTGLSKEGQTAQSSMGSIAQAGWDKLESEQTGLTDEIKQAGDLFRKDLDKLTASVGHRLDTLMDSRNQELTSLSEQILTQLKESNDAYNVKIAQRFERFEQRTNEETAAISSSLERNMRSMIEEIESSLERAVEKLKNTRFELEQTVAHTIAVSEMAIAQKAKHLLTESLLPRLNEQKEIIRTMIGDMSKQVVTESTASLDSEIAKLDQGTNFAAESLRKVADECVSEVEMIGRGIKTGLEDSFKRASSDLMVRTREVGDKIRETERRMADSEYALKGLAEASTVDSEPELAEERNHAVSKLASLKQEASRELSNAIEENIDHLDSESERLFSELSNNRSELTSQIRDTAESHISKVRQALSEATSAIQAAREKHME